MTTSRSSNRMSLPVPATTLPKGGCVRTVSGACPFPTAALCVRCQKRFRRPTSASTDGGSRIMPGVVLVEPVQMARAGGMAGNRLHVVLGQLGIPALGRADGATDAVVALSPGCPGQLVAIHQASRGMGQPHGVSGPRRVLQPDPMQTPG